MEKDSRLEHRVDERITFEPEKLPLATVWKMYWRALHMEPGLARELLEWFGQDTTLCGPRSWW